MDLPYDRQQGAVSWTGMPGFTNPTRNRGRGPADKIVGARRPGCRWGDPVLEETYKVDAPRWHALTAALDTYGSTGGPASSSRTVRAPTRTSPRGAAAMIR